MLPVQGDETASQLAQRFGRRRPAVDLCRVAFAELALQHQCRAA